MAHYPDQYKPHPTDHLPVWPTNANDRCTYTCINIYIYLSLVCLPTKFLLYSLYFMSSMSLYHSVGVIMYRIEECTIILSFLPYSYSTGSVNHKYLRRCGDSGVSTSPQTQWTTELQSVLIWFDDRSDASTILGLKYEMSSGVKTTKRQGNTPRNPKAATYQTSVIWPPNNNPDYPCTFCGWLCLKIASWCKSEYRDSIERLGDW